MSTSNAIKALAAAAIFAGSSVHATPNIPQPAQTKPLLIIGATLHTVSGAVIANGRMLVLGGRITAISGPDGILDSKGAEVVNLEGKHVYPGFVAANTVLGLTEISAVRATSDFAEVGSLNPNVRALVAINADSELMTGTRANGVPVISPAAPACGIDSAASTPLARVTVMRARCRR